MDNGSSHYCVIGAGAAGLAATRRLKEAGIPVETLDAQPGVGGLWRFRPDGPLFRSTHTISPKSVQAFADFPMPGEYPDFPHHTLALKYLEDYARHHRLLDSIRFDTRVKTIAPDGDGWEVTLDDGARRRYRGVLIASGKHDQPFWPRFAGRFEGEMRHSRDYDDPVSLRGKRVLVVGAGQSAIDLVAESAVVADRTYHSTRRGLFSFPRYMFGRPFEEYLQSELPLKPVLGPLLLPLVWRLGEPPARCGLARNDRRSGLPHPTVGREMFRYYQQGDVVHKPDVAELRGSRVRFADGSEEGIDVIYCATGYCVSYPFIDRKWLNWPDGSPRPDLYLHTFPPDSDSLFVIGMMQPLGSHWTTYDEQSRLVAAVIQATERRDARCDEFRRRKRTERPRLDGGVRYYRADDKPMCDVDKFAFRRAATGLIDWLRS
jgi:hypothetical protein